MKLYKQDLLTLLISLFIFSSCQNIDSIGLDADPSTNIGGYFVDTITVQTSTVREDSIRTNGLSQYPLGYFTDPLFGKSSAEIAMTVDLSIANTNFGPTAELDSAVLVLFYGKEFYGDSTSRFKIEVHQLAEALDGSKDYYNTATHSYNPEIIADQLVTFRPKDSVRITDIVTSGPDVQVTKAPQIRIPIDPAFINEQFLDADSIHFTASDLFIKHFKGLYLKVNPAESVGPGGIGFLNLSDSSRIDLYYKKTSGSTIDTLVTPFPIYSGSQPVAARFTHDYTGTEILTQLNNPATSYDYTFVQGLGGLRTKVRFPYIDKLKEFGNITINKAELVVYVEGGTDSYQPSPRLIMYQTDIAKQRQFIPDFGVDRNISLTDAEFGGYYDESTKRYRFIITTYIQDILKGKLTQYDAYIAPVNVDYSRSEGPVASGTNSSRAVIGSGKDGVTYKMKLNILYSKTN
jgi:hypothetical protein